MTPIPSETKLDYSLAFILDPYRFISRRCHHYQSDIFETRIQLQKTICLQGEEAAKLFYNKNYFMRQGAAPSRLIHTLFGVNAIQGTDGACHHARKQMFVTLLMTKERIEALRGITRSYWQTYANKWQAKSHIVFYREVQEILTQAVCKWAGLPLPEKEVKQRTSQFVALFEGAGAIGPKHWWSRFQRKRADQWIEDIIDSSRKGKCELPKDSVLAHIAQHTELNTHTAAVEMINILRPVVAISVFITFIALALEQYPQYRQKLQAKDEKFKENFVQEVRRFYPFFPAITALVRRDFTWKNYFFPKGRKVMLDLYGTNHDARSWKNPQAFYPERFANWNNSAFNFIPQGGADHETNHRCPGEWITIELMKDAVEFLIHDIHYRVPHQNLKVNMRRLPAIPKSGLVLTEIKLRK